MFNDEGYIDLVTGGAGFIGSHLIKRLLNEGHNVICLDDLSTGNIKNISDFKNHKKFSFFKKSVIEECKLKVDFIWHLASPASPNSYQKNPIQTSKVNYLGSLNMLNLAVRNNARILLSSTSEIYGQNFEELSESNTHTSIDSKSIRSCYSQSKLLAETLFFDFKRIYHADIRIARLFNIYGPNKNLKDGRVVSNLIIQALQNQFLTIHGDGNQTRSFCHIDDTIDALFLLMKCEYKEIINIGNPLNISIKELAKLIISKVDPDLKLKFLPKLEDDPFYRKPSIKLAEEVLGWAPKINLNEGLDTTIDFYRKFLNK